MTRRLRLPALAIARAGLALVALTAAAWLTGTPYLLVRLGWSPPFPLARVDGPHIYMGIALAAVVGLKVAQLHLGGGLAKLSSVLRWQRWLSLGMLLTYGGVLASGLLLLLPWPAPLMKQLVNLHLLTAGWAGIITLFHAITYMRRRLPAGSLDLRLVAGLVVILLPGLALAQAPRAAAPLTQLGAGGTWESIGPRGAFTSRIAVLPDGELVAGGSGLWTSSDRGNHWSAVPGLAEVLVRTVATGANGTPVYLGTDQGVWAAGSVAGPYRPTALAGIIESVYVTPSDPQHLLAGGAGLWETRDGGATWTARAEGLIPRGLIWTIDLLDGELYAAGTTGVYRWEGSAWTHLSSLPSVYSLDPGPNGEIWASSMGSGLQVLRGGRWVSSAAGLAPHSHTGRRGVHVDGFTALPGNRAVVATMDSGVAESMDGGASWSSLSAGFKPGDVWQVLPVDGSLIAATDTGLYRYRQPVAPPPASMWWLTIAGAALLCALAGSALGLTLGSNADPVSARMPKPSDRRVPSLVIRG